MAPKGRNAAAKRPSPKLPERSKGRSKKARQAEKGKLKKSSSSLDDKDSTDKIKINRAPVLTLWIAACLQRLGYNRDLALGVGKVFSQRCAIAKGRSLGVLKKPEAKATVPSTSKKRPAASGLSKDEDETVDIAGQKFRAISTDKGLLAADPSSKATSKTTINPAKVEAYLKSAFKNDLPRVEDAMKRAAQRKGKEALRGEAMSLYEEFRPSWAGWGVKGTLSLSELARACN